MERIVEYHLSESEFEKLVDGIKSKGYEVHGYCGVNEVTIDDGKSVRFEDCSKFSVCTPLEKGGQKLRVKDSRLIGVIDSFLD